MGLGQLGAEFHSLLILGYRLVEPSQASEEPAQVVKSLGRVRLDFQRLPILGYRLVSSAPMASAMPRLLWAPT